MKLEWHVLCLCGQYQVAAFLHECAQRSWHEPPELLFGECYEPTAAQVAELAA